jgi:hypothetical protein
MSLSDHFSITLRTKVLFAFTFAIQFIATVYAAHEFETPPSFELLSHLALLWIIALWIKADSKRIGKTWPLDLGMYLAAAWIVILPYHLFRTRGAKAFIGIFSFIGVSLAGWAIAVIVVLLLWR